MVEVDSKPAQENLTHGLTLNQIDQAENDARMVAAILSVATFAAEADDFMETFRVYREHLLKDSCIELPGMPDLSTSDLGVMLSGAAIRAHAIHETLRNFHRGNQNKARDELTRAT